jgi:HD-GYP domain-containing protein (c-di-GMP phosphodiesterase class II)
MKSFNVEKAIFAAVTGSLEKDRYETVITYANPIAISLFGKEILSMKVTTLLGILLNDMYLGRSEFERLLAHGQLQLEGKYNDRYIYLNSVVDTAEDRFQASIFDITDRRRSQQVFEYTASSLARAAEVYDDDTGDHIQRINLLSGKLAKLADAEPELIAKISFYAQLHDVGKIHVDPNIIRKPGRLTDDEFRAIQMHTINGAKIIGKHPALRMARRIALSHHEKWDGNGYPYGLQGESIPLEARIVSIVDVFDALMSPRAYKPAFSPEKVYSIYRDGDDRLDPQKHFDPRLLALFLNHFDEFVRLYEDSVSMDSRYTSSMTLSGKESASLSSLAASANIQ